MFDEGSLRLCAVGELPPECGAVEASVPGGEFSVDPTTGVVTFTPVPGFHGKVEVPYQVTTEDGTVVDAVIVVWVVDPPQAADDVSSGGVDQVQVLDPFVNDSPDSAAPWDISSLRLCGPGQVAPGCDRMEVVTPEGTYVIDPVTGMVVFTPVAGFTGTPTPVGYQVGDAAGQVTGAWLRPVVRGSGGGDPSQGTVRLVKQVAGDGHARESVRLEVTCTGGGRGVRAASRVLPVGRGSGSWDVAVGAGMVCSVSETDLGLPEAVDVAPTGGGVLWPVSRVPVLAPGEGMSVGTAVAVEELELSATGGCRVQAGRLVGEVAGLCTVTWRVPDALVGVATTWTRISGRSVRVGEGAVSVPFAVRAGATTTVRFTNTYTAADLVLTRTVRVMPGCTVSADQGRVGVEGTYRALTGISVPQGCTRPQVSVTCTPLTGGRSLPQGDYPAPCSWELRGATLRITTSGQPVRIRVTLTSHPQGRPARTTTTTHTWTT